MTLPSAIGIESHILASSDVTRETLRARLRIDNSTRKPGEAFPDGDWLEVSVNAVVYDAGTVERLGRLPAERLDQGASIMTQARNDWTVVDLPFPPLRFGEYIVVAKVVSADDRFRKTFEPSSCYASRARLGLVAARMSVQDLLDVYQGVTNPLAEDEIKRMVRSGLILAEDDLGQTYDAAEVGGELTLKPRALRGAPRGQG